MTELEIVRFPCSADLELVREDVTLACGDNADCPVCIRCHWHCEDPEGHASMVEERLDD